MRYTCLTASFALGAEMSCVVHRRRTLPHARSLYLVFGLVPKNSAQGCGVLWGGLLLL